MSVKRTFDTLTRQSAPDKDRTFIQLLSYIWSAPKAETYFVFFIFEMSVQNSQDMLLIVERFDSKMSRCLYGVF